MEPYVIRKGFEGLHAAVGERLKEDVRSGAFFVLPTSATRGSRCFTSMARDSG
jgi:hypothetical protein